MSFVQKVLFLKDKDDPESSPEEDEVQLESLAKRRGSVELKKLTWSQKLLGRNKFSRKPPRSGNVTPTDRLSQLRSDDYMKFRSNSIDLGGTKKSPIQPRKMFRRHEDLIEGMQSLTVSDADSEVQSYTRKKSLIPPVGTTEYLASGNDSLASIAAKHKSTTSELTKINKLMSTMVFPGQKLFVPTEDYVPIGYGSQASSPRTSPKLRSGSIDPTSSQLKQRRKSLDESKKGKKAKSTQKDRRPSEIVFPKRRKSVTTKGDILFSTRVDYVTGDKDPCVPGQLQITNNEVNFEPDFVENDPMLKELVQYRLSLGKAMIAANFVDKNPYSVIQERNRETSQSSSADDVQSKEIGASQVKQTTPTAGDAQSRKNSEQEEEKTEAEVKRRPSTEKASDFWTEYASEQGAILFGPTEEKKKTSEADENTENKEETENHEAEKKDDVTDQESPSSPSSSPLESPVLGKYLMVKLGIPSEAIKERPTISSLIRGSLPLTATVQVDHCFLIPNEIVAELTIFLQTNYPDAYGKTDVESLEDRFEDVIKQPTQRNSRQFRRTISVAELCHLPLPEMSQQSSILTETHIRILREHLLTSAEGRPWRLVYSTSVHGYSINTLYRSMIKTDMTTLLLVADMENRVFGAMLPNSIRQSEGFYGNGETFLFTFHPSFKKFTWSGKNFFFLKGNPNNFYIGASDGVFALWLHDDLDHGRTQRCETFDNEPLTGDSEDFNIRCIEVWQFPFSLD